MGKVLGVSISSIYYLLWYDGQCGNFLSEHVGTDSNAIEKEVSENWFLIYISTARIVQCTAFIA